LRAAEAAACKNPKLKIAIISKVYPIRSHTVCAEGGVAGVMSTDNGDSFRLHAADTIRGGDGLCDIDAVDFFVKNAPEELKQLEDWGCPWSRDSAGNMAVRAFGGMSVKRTAFAADKTGFFLLHALYERTLKHKNITRLDEWFVTKLLIEDKNVRGVIAMNLRDGKIEAFAASAVILATGGAGQMYRFTSNSNICTGDGMALAMDAGLPLKDIEFVQFHPTGLPRTGILITEAARGEGGYLINKNGERFLKNYLPEKLELSPRDAVTRAIMDEIEAGRGIDGPFGKHVYLDIRHLGKKTIDEKLPQVRELAQKFAGVDPVKELIPVMPVCHYFMGGVPTDINAQTAIHGLFAAGETACTGLHGANRLGSNSLSECLVFGKVAGENAAAFSPMSNPNSRSLSTSLLADEESRIKKLINQKGELRCATVRERLQEIMSEHVGIKRNEKSLEEGINKILELKEQSAQISLSDRSLVFNTELTSLFELKNMLTVAEAVVRSALHRKESRGAHFRTDFPKKDYLNTHIFIKNSDKDMIITTAECKV